MGSLRNELDSVPLGDRSRLEHGGVQAQAAVEAAGRTCRVIGAVGAGHPGVIMARKGRETPLPRFERDELARFLDAPAEQTRNPEGSDA